MMSQATPQADAQPPELHAYPSDLTFHDLIRRNRRNSVLLMIGMGLLVMAVAAAIGILVMIYGRGVITTQGILLALAAGLIVVIVSTTWSYYGGGKTLLRINGARPIDKADDPQLFNVVEEMSIAAGIPLPQVYLIDSASLNAFATGRDPEHAAVAITTGLRQRLTRDELAGVIAHEIAHIRHYDIRMTMLLATLVGMIVLAAHVAWRSVFYARAGGGGRRGKGGGAAMLILLLVVVFLSIIAPLLAKLIQFAVSRQREYLADAGAVELTRYPRGLADALRKLGGDSTPMQQASKATAHMYIVNPILNARGKQDFTSAFSTHPPLKERIARLEALAR